MSRVMQVYPTAALWLTLSLKFHVLAADVAATEPAERMEPTCPGLESWLHNETSFAPRGYHVLCFTQTDTSALQGSAWLSRNGSRSGALVQLGPATSFKQLRTNLRKAIGMKIMAKMWKNYPWRIYDTNGSAVQSFEATRPGSIWLVFEGGEFMWPAVRIGYERRIDVGLQQPVVMRTVSCSPVAFVIDNFIRDSEAAELITKAEPSLRRSSVAFIDNSEEEDQSSGRTSWHTTVENQESLLLQNLTLRARAQSKLRGYIEDVQILRYQAGQFYEQHWDYFDPRQYLQQDYFLSSLGHRRNRILTSFWYLTTPEGGETGFPLAQGSPEAKSARDCKGEEVLRVEAKKGRAIFFYSVHADATLDPTSKHIGCPVHRATKWSANFWFWNADSGMGGSRPSVETDEEIQAAMVAQRLGEEKRRRLLALKEIDDPSCPDEHPKCLDWAIGGECVANPGYMLSSCRRSCEVCKPLQRHGQRTDL